MNKKSKWILPLVCFCGLSFTISSVIADNDFDTNCIYIKAVIMKNTGCSMTCAYPIALQYAAHNFACGTSLAENSFCAGMNELGNELTGSMPSGGCNACVNDSECMGRIEHIMGPNTGIIDHVLEALDAVSDAASGD